MPDDLPASSSKEDRVSLPPIYTNFDDRRPSPQTAPPNPDAMNAYSSSYAGSTAAAAPVPEPWISRRPDDGGYAALRASSTAGAYRHDAFAPPPAQQVPRQWASAHPERRQSFTGSASAYPYSPSSYSGGTPMSATSDDAWSPGGNAHYTQAPYPGAGSVQSLGVLPIQHSGVYAHGMHQAPPGMGALPLPLMDRPGAPQRRRGKLPKQTTEYLKDWLHKHADHPYPSEDEKKRLCAATGLSMSQVSNWMINARRRILAPNRNNATPATTTTPYQPQAQAAAAARPDSAGSNGSAARAAAAGAAPTAVRARGSSDSFTQYQGQPYSPSSSSPRAAVASGVPGYAAYPPSAGYAATGALPSQGYDIIGAPSSAGGSSTAGGGSPHGSAGSGDDHQ